MKLKLVQNFTQKKKKLRFVERNYSSVEILDKIFIKYSENREIHISEMVQINICRAVKRGE